MLRRDQNTANYMLSLSLQEWISKDRCMCAYHKHRQYIWLGISY